MFPDMNNRLPDHAETVYRRLTLAYVAALVIIASLTISMGFFLVRANQDNQKSAEIVNMAGRQRMLTVDIAWLALQYTRADDTSRANLRNRMERVISLLNDSNQYLSNEIKTGIGGDPMGELLIDQYQGSYGVMPLINDFNRMVHALLSARMPGDRDTLYQQIASHSVPLLEKFDLIVSAHQENSRLRLERISQMSFIVELCLLMIIFLLGVLVFRPVVHRVREQHEKLIAVAHTDPLTGLLNRRTFLQIGEKITMTCRRLKSNCSVLFVDIDHFKKINDTHGHAAGDEVLVRVSQAITATLRGGDIVGRLGGEEFVVILPDASEEQAVMVAERIREIVSTMDIHINGAAILVACSIGAAEMRNDDKDVGETLMRADFAMYQAKQAGRNRVEKYSTSDV